MQCMCVRLCGCVPPLAGGFNYPNISEAQLYGLTFCSALNCSTGNTCNTACLRAASVADIVSAWEAAAGNVIDFILSHWDHLLDGFLQFTPVRGRRAPQSAAEPRDVGSGHAHLVPPPSVCARPLQVLDGVEIVAEPQDALATGQWAKVPVFVGSNSNEVCPASPCACCGCGLA